MVLCLLDRLGPAVGVATAGVALVVLSSPPVRGRRVRRKLLQRMDLPRLCSSVRLVEVGVPHPADGVRQPSSPAVVCSSVGSLLPAVRLFCRTPPAVSWVGCAVDVRTAASPRCRCARVVLLSVMLSSRRVSIAVLVPASRRKGSGHDELVALAVGPLSPVPVVLDHLLLSCRQVCCHPHTLSLQLLLAFGQDVHFVRPLGKLGYDGLWFGVAIVVVVVAKAVCTDDIITRPVCSARCYANIPTVFLCKCQSFRCETAGC